MIALGRYGSTRVITFKADESLYEITMEYAKRLGVTVSDIIRYAVFHLITEHLLRRDKRVIGELKVCSGVMDYYMMLYRVDKYNSQLPPMYWR